jgi:hypothetical protein
MADGSEVSEFDRQMPALDLRDGHPMPPATLFKDHLALIDRQDASGERRLAAYRSGRDHLGQTARKAPIIRLVPERAIQPRRGHFKGVVLRQRPGGFEFLAFDVEEGAQIVADALTLFDPDGLVERFGHAAIRPIDDYPQYGADRLAAELDLEDLQPVTACYPLGCRAHARQLLSSWRKTRPHKKKKWAQAHSGTLTRSCHP